MHPKNLLGPESGACPTRVLIDQLADKWAILVMLALDGGAVRFNALRREVEGHHAEDAGPDAAQA